MSVEPITPKPQRARAANDLAVPHVALAIKAIMKEVRKEGISKDRKNQQQSYNFRGIDDVLNVLSGMLPEADLIIIPRVLSRTQVERNTAKGGVLFFSTVEADYTFKSTLDGSETLVGPFYGEAMDSADKATNKAMSAAYKYMAIQTFCIPTEGDNDADATTHEVVPAAGRPSPARPQLNSSQAKKADLWPRFKEKIDSITDLDELERWWAMRTTQEKISEMPGTWAEQAQEEYEKAQERLLNAGRP